MIESDIVRRRAQMLEEIDENDYEQTELKVRTESSKAARSALKDMINFDSIVSDFKHYNLLIHEEDSTDEI